jgi:hypothetical protein
MARLIQHKLVDADLGIYRYDQLIVLQEAKMPSVFLEAGSIINRDEELQMNSPERRDLITASRGKHSVTYGPANEIAWMHTDTPRTS